MSEAEAIYGWFDSLGFPDLSRCPFVKVADGGWSIHGTDPPQKSFLYGFLVEDDGTHFRFFIPDFLQTRSCTRTPPGDEPLQAIYHERADLAPVVEQWLAEHGPHLSECAGWVKYNPQHVGWQLRDAVLRAWSCARQGLPELAGRIVALAQKLHDEYQRHHGGSTLRQQVSDEIAHVLLWQAIEAFADPAVSRRDLLSRFEHILEKFAAPPGGEPVGDERFGWLVGAHSRHALEAAAVLRKMIAEGEEHAQRPAPPLANQGRQEQIAELIFDLRDQAGRQLSDPGSCSIFADERGEQSPAWQLVRFGLDAVPQLIDALGDDRFTRSVGHHRSYYFSHHVLRVGDCALSILEQIAGRSFWEETYTNAAMVKDGQVAEVRERVLAWWQEVQQLGEQQQQLVRAVAVGDRDSPSQASRLIARYPEATLEAVREGTRRAADAHVHSTLVSVAGQLSNQRAIDWLREQLQSRWLSSRVAAARALWTHGYRDALTRMLHEWHQLPHHPEWLNGPATWDTAGIGAWYQVCSGPFDLMNFLVLCQEPEAIRALAAGKGGLPIDHRIHLIEMLDAGRFLSFSWGETRWGSPPEPPEVAGTIDELLVGCLDDTEVRSGWSGVRGGKSFQDPRVGDMAAHVLSRRWHQPSRFDLEAPLPVLDRQRGGLKNVWRRRHGEPPLPLPGPAESPPLSTEEAQPLLQRVLAAATSEDRRQPVQAVEELGLPALPAVREAARAAGAECRGSLELKRLAGRLAFVADRISLMAPVVGTPAELTAAVEGLRGKPLEIEAILSVLVTALRTLPEGQAGIRLTIEREGDDTGAELVLLMEGANAFSGDPRAGWDVSELVRIDGEIIREASTFSSPERGRSAEQWSLLAPALEKALRASPEQRVSIHVSAAHAKAAQ